jgi:alkylhydroperoxidase family enzyme
MSRIAYVDEANCSPEAARALANSIAIRGKIGNFHRAMAHSPPLVDAFETFSLAVRTRLAIEFPLYALVVLRTVQLRRNRYEWPRCVPVGLANGVKPEQVIELWRWRESPFFDARHRAALSIVDEYVGTNDVAARTIASAKESLSDAEIVSVCAGIGWFMLCFAIIVPLGLADDDSPQPQPLVGMDEQRFAEMVKGA